MLNRTLAHYRLVEKIGVGGMGEVYRAHDEHLQRDVAVKILPAGLLTDTEARKRFRKEALALSKLNHPNVQIVHDFNTQDDVDFLVTEYVPGVTLSERLTGPPVPESEIIALGMQLAEGLSAAHTEGVVHRDIKPANLRVTPEGRLKVLDFGLARLVQPLETALTEEDLGKSGAVVSGTLPYMAPEQLSEQIADTRTDIYAAGAVLYEMATGQRPFPGNYGPRLIQDILYQPPKPPSELNPRISPRLEEIILKCLEKEPDYRYQSARELLADFRRLAAPTHTTGPVRVPRRKPRRWLPAAVAAGVVVLAAGVWLGKQIVMPPSGTPAMGAIAVLPLENLSRDPAQEYFSDGMTEALIAQLAQIRALKVISRTSAMQYKGAKKSMRDIATELSVDGVVEGSVLRAGNRVRINAQLIRAKDDQLLWAASYERDLTDVLALQNEVARAIAREIRIAVTPEVQDRLQQAAPVQPVAYEAYLQGRYQLNKRTPEAIARAFENFEKSLASDPSYALGHAGLADAHAISGVYGSREAGEAFSKAREAATRALELDPGLGEAHSTLGMVKFFHDWDWAGAEKEFQRALQLNPSHPTARYWYAYFLMCMGRKEEALAEATRARERDPLSQVITQGLATIYVSAGQFDQAIDLYRKNLDAEPKFAPAHSALALAYAYKRMYKEAFAAAEQAVALQGKQPDLQTLLGYLHAVSGNRKEALKIIEELKALPEQMRRKPLFVATVYLGLGDNDQAMDWLEKAYQEHAQGLVAVRGQLPTAHLRDNPRFQELLRKMNLPE